MTDTNESQSRVLVGEVTRQAPAARVYMNVEEIIPILDTSRFEHMQRIATAMATSSLIPDCLRGTGSGNSFVAHSTATVISNCFLVTEQAVRWNMSPFAVAQCCSIVHGRLMYEGKLVAAVLQSRLQVDLDYLFGHWDAKAEANIIGPEGDGINLGVTVRERGGDREIHGSVGTWKTDGAGSPWKPGAYKRQLRYRGAREWSRAFEPGVMLGVVTEDEMDDMTERRFSRAEAGPRPSLSAGFGDETTTRALDAPRTADMTERSNDAAQSTEAPSASTGAALEGEIVETREGPTRRTRKLRAEATAPTQSPEASGSPTGESSPETETGPTSESHTKPLTDETESHGTSDGSEDEQSQGGDSSSPRTSSGLPASDDFPGDRGAPQEDAPNPFIMAIAAIGNAPTWAIILHVLIELAKQTEWKASEESSKLQIRRAAWNRYSELDAAGGEPVAITEHNTLFRFWLEFGAASAGEIDGMWRVYYRGSAYKALLDEGGKTDAQIKALRADKERITKFVAERKAALG